MCVANKVIGVWFIFLSVCSSLELGKTYQHESDGVFVTCNKCKPGEYFLRECIKDGGESVCKLCPTGTFNTHHSKALKCALCNTQCKDPDREELASNCTSIADISCVCLEGFYREKGSGICLKQTDCQPGKGVQSEDNVDLIVGLSVGISVPILLAVAVCFLRRTERGKKWIEQHKNNDRRSPDQPEKIPLNGTVSHGVNGGPAENHFTDIELQNLAGDLTNQEYPVFFRHLFEEVPFRCQVTNCGPAVNPLTEVELDTSVGDLNWTDYGTFFHRLFDKEANKHILEASLDYDEYKIRMIIYQILKKWQQVDKDNATKNKIIKVFREIGWNDLADKYSEQWEIYGNGHTNSV